VVPDLTYLPQKYHKFVTNHVRRVYVDLSANNDQREALKTAEQRLARKADVEQLLMKRCEELAEALNAHRQGERDANERIMELEEDIANMEKLVKESDGKVRELQRMHDLAVDKVKFVEKCNQVLQKENVKLSLATLRHHERKQREERSHAKEKQLVRIEYRQSDGSSQSPITHSAAFPHKRRKYVVRLPQGHPSAPSNTEYTSRVSSSEDTPAAIFMSTPNSSVPLASASTSRLVDPSRPIKPLPKRRRLKNRLISLSNFMAIDVSNFL
jgi:hypothetical protein